MLQNPKKMRASEILIHSLQYTWKVINTVKDNKKSEL